MPELAFFRHGEELLRVALDDRMAIGRDPACEVSLPDGAVGRIVALESDDVGEFGVEFFKLVLERDPAFKARVRIEAPTSRLLGNGYLGVLALGGMKVTWWLVKNGVKNPKAAIDRLRGK